MNLQQRIDAQIWLWEHGRLKKEFSEKSQKKPQTQTDVQAMCKKCGVVKLPHTCPKDGTELVRIKRGHGGI